MAVASCARYPGGASSRNARRWWGAPRRTPIEIPTGSRRRHGVPLEQLDNDPGIVNQAEVLTRDEIRSGKIPPISPSHVSNGPGKTSDVSANTVHDSLWATDQTETKAAF